MSLQTNKQLIQRFWEEIWNQGNMTAVEEIVTPDFVLITPQGEKKGPEGLRQWVTAIRKAAPDIHFTIEQEVAEGEKVATAWSGRGTNTGSFLGNPPSGKPITLTGISIFYIERQKVQTACLEEHIS